MVGMGEEKGLTRPRQVTTAVVIAVIGCLVLVIGLFDTLGNLRTPSMRESVDDFLGKAPGSSLGLDTPQVIDLMRALAFVSGALAAMGLVFAIFALQRHGGARIGYTVVVALLLLTVPVAGLMPFFLAAAAFLLWSGPARDWFAGRKPARVAAPATAAASEWSYSEPPPPERQVPVEQPAAGSPGAEQPAGDQPAAVQPAAHPSPYGQPAYGQPPAYPQQPQGSGADHAKRPLTVTLAAILTWIGAGATTLLMLGFIAILASGGGAFVDEFDRAARESDVSLGSAEILAVGWVIAVTLLVWSLIAVVLAIFAFRRSNGARWTLVVSAVMSALFSLVAIMSVLSIITLLLSVGTVVMLFAGGANQWYAQRSTPTYPQPLYPPQGPPEPQRRNQPW
jgi:hypothetical protein